jgi:cation-transporting ATPase I
MHLPSFFRPSSVVARATSALPRPALVRRLLELPRARPRVCQQQGEVALIELRGVPVEALPKLERELHALCAARPEITSVEINPYLRRVRFTLGPEAPDLEALEALVVHAELACRGPGTPLPAERELPDDELLHLQRWVELIADSAGLGLGAMLRVLPFFTAGFGTNAAALLTLVKGNARLRAPLERRLGKDRAELLLGLMLAFAQGLSQRPLSSMVDVGYRLSALREHEARARLFARRRRELFEHAAACDLAPEAVLVGRPTPLPEGPLEAYAGRAWMTAASAFGFSLLTSRSVRRAGAAMFSALPKPAHLGRELYVKEVGRLLAQRGTLVLAPEALRRLDRVDCLVLDAALLSHARFSLGRIEVRARHDARAVQARVRALFDPRRPTELQQAESFQLGPLPLLQARADDAAHDLAAELSAAGSLVLALGRDSELWAVVEVRIGGRGGIEDLVELAQQGGLRVVVAAERDQVWSHLGSQAVEVIAGGAQLVDGIRLMQRQGQMVCYVGLGSSPALSHADCAVSVRDPGAPMPWAAHILCEPDLEGLHTLLRACLLARSVSRQSVNLAMGAAAVGAVASAGGKGGASQRVMLVVNVATVVAMLNALRRAAPLGDRARTLPPDLTPWHALEAAAVLARLHSGAAGLSDVQAVERAQAQPAHEPSAPVELSAAIAQELLNPLAPLLAAGAGLSALVGSTLDAGIVAGVGGINAVVGGVQRYRTERAIRALVRPARVHVRVRRDGATRLLPAEELVPGDIVLFTPGEEVPADCRILQSNALEVDTSILTGESLPSAKNAAASFETALSDRSCMLYAGTRVVAGSATAVVVAVGEQVEARRGALARSAALHGSGVEARLRELMQLTGPIATVGGLAVVLAGLLRGRGASEMVETGVSMAVAAIPEGLPLLASAAQLSTAERLSKKGALVRNARCIEALGRVDVICLDKTGTLTEGQLELHLVSDAARAVPLDALEPAHRRVLAAALRASAAEEGGIHSSPTDAALARAAAIAGIEREEGRPSLRPHAEYPFESARGYHAVFARIEAGVLVSVKGAPETLLARCREQIQDGVRVALASEARDALVAKAAELAAAGLRVLAVAESERGDADTGGELERLCFLGFLAFRDAARPQVQHTLSRLRAAGIEVVMLTGDHINTARSIATEIDLLRGRECIGGGGLSQLGDTELTERVDRFGVFARVTPSEKVRIVHALQRRGHVVAMVGDGANDAPALRAAEVGVALGQGCAPAARAAADIVLTEVELDRLLDCILEARAMWLSVRDAVSILLGGNLGEIGFGVAAGLVSGRPPLSARQLLLVNFLTDIAPAMAVALRRPPQSAYEQLDRGRPEEQLRAHLTRAIAVRAVSTALGASWAWGLGRLTGTRSRASTVALCALVGSQLGQTILSRGTGRRVTVTALCSWAALFAIVQTPGLSQLFGCRPIGPVGWSLALGSSAAATLTSAGLSALDERFAQWLEQHEPLQAEVTVLRTLRERMERMLASMAVPGAEG